MPQEAGSCAYVLGADGLTRWREPHSGAWLGLLQAHRQVTRELESRLEARFGLSLSGLELLGRLAAAPARRLRLSVLAGATGPPRLGLADGAAPLLLIGHVMGDRYRAAGMLRIEFGCDRPCAVAIDVRDRHPRTLLREHARGGST